MSDEYPFTGKFCDLDGIRMHYLDEGAGDPVVMVHGNPSWSFYYRNLVKKLSATHRCIAPDHVGCGLSDKPRDDMYRYTLAQRCEDLGRLLEHAGVTGRVTLVMHDWGGMIGMLWAARNPEKIARLVVLNTAAFRLPRGKRFPLTLRLFRDTPLGALMVYNFNAFAAGTAWIGCKRRRMPKALQREYVGPYLMPADRIATLRFVEDIPLGPADPAWPFVLEAERGLAQFRETPMLIGWGAKDFVFDRHFLEEWRRRFPDAEVHAFPDCGHYILEDAPELAGKIGEFIEKTT